MASDFEAPRFQPVGPRPDPGDDDTTRALEDLLRLGAAALGVERCIAGLASPRDGWIRSVIGVASDEARNHAGFCSFAMSQPGTTVVTDLRNVGALAHLPLVRSERGYLWLACAPLVDDGGVKRGGLVALGTAARELSREDRELFGVLGRQIVTHLEHRRRLEEQRARGLHQAGALSMLRGVLKASTTVAVIGTDLAGRIKLFSEGAERMLGVPARDAVGRTPAFLLAGLCGEGAEETVFESGARPISFAALIEGVGRDTPVERTWLLRRADGSLFPASIVAAFVTNERAEASGYALIARDVTEQRAVERMKDDFVSMVSHELRTPLTSIRGALGLLAGEVAGPLTPPVHELVDIAHANTDRLLHVVGDILDVQRLASGSMELSLSRVALRLAAERAVQLVGPLCAEQQVTVALRRSAEDDAVEADFERVVQVLVNLLSNAVKHSPPGGTVHVDVEPHGESVRVSVEDAGKGIPEHLRGRLFQKFGRLSAEPGSTGLGLAIVKAIVALHRGTVAFRAASPRGAIFSFDLPRCHAAPEQADAEAPRPPAAEELVNAASPAPLSLRACPPTRRAR
jgi:PAS domain S-box-containing protein